jgi:two-component system response regulator HydG
MTTKTEAPALAPARVLVVDDHENMVASLGLTLRLAGYEVTEAVGGEAALAKLASGPFDVVTTDLRMDPVDGLAVLRRALALAPSTQVLIMTAFGSFETAVEAMKAGAYEYISKPFNDDQFLLKVARGVEKARLLGEVRFLSDDFKERYRLDQIVGRAPPMRELLSKLLRVAPTDAAVLISGEAGTGKELIARALHANSKRAGRPFVPVSCTGIPEGVLEAELFGAAKASKKGLLEEASGGTLFLDDVAELPLTFQSKLLRVLQEGTFRRVGDDTPLPLNVRVIASTKTDLREAVNGRTFREDLFFRLNVVPLRAPALRERREDIPLLAEYFLQRFDERNESRHRWSADATDRLTQYGFPGNVRELQAVVEQAAALATGETIQAAEVLFEQPGTELPKEALGGSGESLSDAVDRAERIAIEQAIERVGGDLQQAARRLQVSSTTLWRRMKRLSITR